MRGGRPPQTATAHSAPARQEQDSQPRSILRTVREPQAQYVLPGPALGESPHEIAFREVNFSERVREFAEEDEALSSVEKVAVSEGHRNVLRLLYQLCPGAAPKSGLREEHQARFCAAAEAGKAVASALPSRRRDRGCCSDPAIESSTP